MCPNHQEENLETGQRRVASAPCARSYMTGAGRYAGRSTLAVDGVLLAVRSCVSHIPE